MFERMITWLNTVISEKSGKPSSKRLGMLMGCLMACLSVCAILGVLVGLSLGVPPHDYVNIYNSLLDTLIWLIGMLLTGGTIGYVTTHSKEQK